MPLGIDFDRLDEIEDVEDCDGEALLCFAPIEDGTFDWRWISLDVLEEYRPDLTGAYAPDYDDHPDTSEEAA